MDNGRQGNSYSSQIEELAELIAWQGYEFWSAQVEAEMEFQADFEPSAGPPQPKEGKSDVFPF